MPCGSADFFNENMWHGSTGFGCEATLNLQRKSFNPESLSGYFVTNVLLVIVSNPIFLSFEGCSTEHGKFISKVYRPARLMITLISV